MWKIISRLFHNIFNISLTSGAKLHIHLLNVVVRFIVFLTSATLIFAVRIRDNEKTVFRLFVCVEVLRPSQPNGVMSSAVSLPNHTFTGQT